MKRKDIPCKICGLLIANAWGYTVHMKRHKKELNHHCTTCGASYVSKYELQLHSLRHKGEEGLIFKCKFCGRGFSNRSSMYVHEDSHQLTLYKCKHCDLTFHSRLKRGKHQKTHRQAQTMCSKCNKIFVNERFLIRHYTESHPKDTRKKDNPISKAKIIRSKKIQQRTSRCRICGEVFLLKSLLMEHLDNCHPLEKNSVYTYLCINCGKAFCDPKIYYRHVKQHALQRSFHCTECPYKAVRRTDLKKHSLKHINFKPFKCENCKCCFKNLSSLNYHKLVHGEKAFKCSQCEKSFSSLKNLGSHVSRHRRVKSICDKCGKTYQNLNMLMDHLKYSHASENDIKFCSHCNTLVKLSKFKQHSHMCFGLKKFSTKWCYLCKKKINKEKILEHFKESHPLHIERCSLCPKIFYNPVLLKQHFSKSHLDINEDMENYLSAKHIQVSNENLECFACGSLFSSSVHLEKHLSCHSNFLNSIRTMNVTEISKPEEHIVHTDDVQIERFKPEEIGKTLEKEIRNDNFSTLQEASSLQVAKLQSTNCQTGCSSNNLYSSNIFNLVNDLSSSLEGELVDALTELVKLLGSIPSQN